MKYKKFIGIDQSLRNTGVVILDDKANVIKTYSWQPKTKDVQRLKEFQTLIENLVSEMGTKDIIYGMEGYSFSKFNMAALGELGGIIKLTFHNCGVELTTYQPTVIKKFICGKGNAKKDLMLKYVFKKYKFDTDDDNLADAFAIARKLYEDNK